MIFPTRIVFSIIVRFKPLQDVHRVVVLGDPGSLHHVKISFPKKAEHATMFHALQVNIDS